MYRCIKPHTRTISSSYGTKEYNFIQNELYVVYENSDTFIIYYSNGVNFQASKLFLENRFIDERIYQKLILREQQIKSVLE
jgi:hypothetical protein